MMKKVGAAEKKDWLVKASFKILGPFSFEEVHQLLKSQAISFSDEVRRTDQRWMQIIEHRDFIAIVESLKFEHDAGELTMTSGTPTSNVTKTDELTRTDQIGDSTDQLTPTPFLSTHSTASSTPENEDQSQSQSSFRDIFPMRESTVPAKPTPMVK